MQRALSWFFAFVGLCLVGCGSQNVHWTLHNTPGCRVSTHHAEVDRERTYLATLLALEARGYVVVETEAPTRIVASYVSGNAPGVARVRWVIGVGPDASLNVDVADGERELHPRVAGWYERLLEGVASLQCRDVDWLRWEAQNRGLVPIGAYRGAELVAQEGTSGAEPGADMAAVAPARQVLLHPNAQRIAEIENERASLHYVRSFSFAAIGAGVAVAGIYQVLYGALFLSEPCEDQWYGEPDCSMRDAGRIMIPVGAGMLALGGTMAAISLSRGLRSLQRFRALGRELKLLRAAGLALDRTSFQHGQAWHVSLKGRF